MAGTREVGDQVARPREGLDGLHREARFSPACFALKGGKIHGKKKHLLSGRNSWGKILQPDVKGTEMEMGWAEHDGNAARSPLSPKEGTWSMLSSSELISEQIRSAGAPLEGRALGKRAPETGHGHQHHSKRHQREEVGEALSLEIRGGE